MIKKLYCLALMATVPVHFSNAKREVELNGEAYFEVDPNPLKGKNNTRIPFLVKTKNQLVEVIGTHFNVSAYTDDPDTKTTLLKGAVKVSYTDRYGSALLKPGQQATIAEQTLEVSEVDVSQAVAWQQGYFVFDNESAESMMRKISRWYDVDVKYSGNIRYRKFGGRISKFENITEILRLMEKTNVIHFRMEGRRIIVMP